MHLQTNERGEGRAAGQLSAFHQPQDHQQRPRPLSRETLIPGGVGERKADALDPSLRGINKRRVWQRRSGDAGAV